MTEPPDAPPRQDPGPEPVLSLSTAAPVHPTIEIDGTLHELALMGDFGIIEQQALTRDGAEFQGLWAAPEELTEAQGLRLKLLLDRMFPKVLKLSRAAQSKLDDEARARVVLAFMREPLRRALQEAAAQEAHQEQVAAQISDWAASLAGRALTEPETEELMGMLRALIEQQQTSTSAS